MKLLAFFIWLFALKLLIRKDYRGAALKDATIIVLTIILTLVLMQ